MIDPKGYRNGLEETGIKEKVVTFIFWIIWGQGVGSPSTLDLLRAKHEVPQL